MNWKALVLLAAFPSPLLAQSVPSPWHFTGLVHYDHGFQGGGLGFTVLPAYSLTPTVRLAFPLGMAWTDTGPLNTDRRTVLLGTELLLERGGPLRGLTPYLGVGGTVMNTLIPVQAVAASGGGPGASAWGLGLSGRVGIRVPFTPGWALSVDSRLVFHRLNGGDHPLFWFLEFGLGSR